VIRFSLSSINPLPPSDHSWLGICIYHLGRFVNSNSGIMTNDSRDCGQRYPMMNQEPARRPPPMGQRYDPEPCWRQSRPPQELSTGQTKEQFVAEMLARPSSVESGPGRPQARPRQQHQDTPAAQARPQPAASEVSVSCLRR
jgi:hypothetical protein